MGFYDLHTHILPGIDDGPTSMGDAVEMAQVAYEDGTRFMLATPHNKDVSENHSIAYVRELLADLSRELRSRGIGLELRLGMENHLELDLAQQVFQGRALTVNSTRYILVELPFIDYPAYTNDVLFQLQLKGLVPIIVHPERNSEIQKNHTILTGLVSRGMLSQITAGSILGSFGPEAERCSKDLLRMGLVHIIASDTHHYRGYRSPVLSAGTAAASKIVGQESARSMVEDVPRAVLEDKALDLEMPRKDSRSRASWRIWE